MKQPCVAFRKNHLTRLFFFGILVGVSFLLRVGPAHAEVPSSQSQDEIKKIESKLVKDRERLRSLGSREKGLLADVARLEQEVAEKRGAIDELNLKIQEGIAESNRLKQNLSQLKRLSAESQKRISQKLLEFYKHTRINYLTIFADVTDISAFLRRVKYIRLVVEKDRASLLRAAEKARDEQDKISQTEAKLKEIREITRKEESRLTSLNKELEDKVLLLITIHQDKKFYETAVQELETAAEALRQTLLDIEKKDAYQTDQSCHFADFKGKLPYPMNGKILKGHTLPEWEKLGTYKGIVIEGPANSKVKTVFPGKVVFSGGLKGYGELVIINHGSRFFTVLANLSGRTKTEGEVVQEGEVVGRVGTHGPTSMGRLYFEIRMAGKGLDPQEWLKPQ